ncbi:MAG TPA: protein-methionine-sulfoxide reductase heme-binding subunit MsrQ [Chloroflexota bacterium]|nr:protein-methionine-sulfoxide reductase heme-binding subunit MsrQ [Chloroflexota bacterium]
MSRGAPLPWLKPGLFIGALAPLSIMVVEAAGGNLGANPVAEIENVLGFSALVLLMASLACTPARRVFGWTWPARVRRLLGLYAFFYVSLHFLTYVLVDQGLDASRIVDDIVKRPFITVGFAALVLLVPLAFTSTTPSIRRLGYRRWNRLHQLAYVAGVLAVIHFIWRVKIDVSQPLAYAAVLTVLLLVRLVYWLRSGAPLTDLLWWRVDRSRSPRA